MASPQTYQRIQPGGRVSNRTIEREEVEERGRGRDLQLKQASTTLQMMREDRYTACREERRDHTFPNNRHSTAEEERQSLKKR